MRKWTRPQCYVGAEWPDYYVFLSRNRDSDSVGRSNFESALQLPIHESNTSGIAIAEALERKLEDYPLLDENLCAEMEHEDAISLIGMIALEEATTYLERGRIRRQGE